MEYIDFMKRGNKLFNGKYTYHRKAWKGRTTKTIITCPIHGDFEQTPASHLRNRECKKCGIAKNARSQKIDFPTFLERAVKKHGDQYSYSPSTSGEHQGRDKEVTATCKDHGEFKTTIGKILGTKTPCIKCRKYTKEYAENMSDEDLAEITSIGELNLTTWVVNSLPKEKIIYTDHMIKDLKYSFKSLIYIPDNKLLIEYNPITQYSENARGYRGHLLFKQEMARRCGYDLIQIWDIEWWQKQDIVKSIIKNRLGLYVNKVWARKCEIKKLTSKEARVIMEKNHLQGYKNGEHHALVYNDETVAVMSVGRRDNVLERFVIKIGWSVPGGFQKLLKSFGPLPGLLTYADKRIFNGRGYEKAGFVFKHDTNPNFYYFKGNDPRTTKLENRSSYTTKRMREKGMKINPNITIVENMKEHGFDVLFDAGNLRFNLPGEKE